MALTCKTFLEHAYRELENFWKVSQKVEWKRNLMAHGEAREEK